MLPPLYLWHYTGQVFAGSLLRPFSYQQEYIHGQPLEALQLGVAFLSVLQITDYMFSQQVF
jgi:hypothetical protein